MKGVFKGPSYFSVVKNIFRRNNLRVLHHLCIISITPFLILAYLSSFHVIFAWVIMWIVLYSYAVFIATISYLDRKKHEEKYL
jgi:hypothetical protein